MSVKIQIKRANASSWTSINPVLDEGEWGFELDTGKLKLGTGSNWNATDYFTGTFTLGEIGDVSLGLLSNGDFLRWSSSASAWVNDPVNLSTDTVGDYVQSLIAGTGVTITNNSGEGTTPTIAIGQNVSTTASVTFEQVTVTGQTNVGGHIIPDTNEAYDLGSSAARFRDIYLSGTTIDLGGATITSDGTDVSFSGGINVGGSANFVGDLTGNADTATTLETARTISLSGDLSGSVSFDGSTDVTISAIVEPNSVALGTDTTGNYVNDVIAGTGVTVTHTPGEGSSASIAIGQAVGITDSPSFAGVTSGSVQVGISAENEIDTTSGNLILDSVDGNVIVDDNLTVNGYLLPSTGAGWSGIVWAPNPGGGLGDSAYINYYAEAGENTRLHIHNGDNEDDDIYLDSFTTNVSGSLIVQGPISGDLVGDVTGNADTATTLETARAISLAGDLSGSVSFDGSSDVTITATVEPNSVALGTDTTGNFVNDIVAGTGVTVTHTPGEGSSASIAIGQDVATSASVTFAKVETTGDVVVGGNLTVNGTTTTLNTETLAVEDNTVVLNSNVTGAPTTNAGIEVERGTSDNVGLRWNETSDKWELTQDGSIYNDIATEAYVDGQTIGVLDDVSDVNAPTPTAGEFLKWNGTAWVNDQIDLGTDTAGDYMVDVTGENGVLITHIPGAGSTASISLAQDINTSASVTFAHIFGDVTGDLTGNADTSSTLETARAISLSGDLSGSASFDGSSNVTITASIEPNSVVLGTDTTGNYMSDVIGGTGVTVSHTPGEGSSASIAIGQDVGTSASVAFSHVSADITGNVTGDVTGNADTATTLQTPRSISLSGDLSGSVSFDGSSDVTITASVEPNSVALGTDTTGNYMTDVVGGTGVTISHTPGEGSSASVSIGQDVATSASVTFAHVSADVTGDLTGNADTASTLETARAISLAGDLSGSVSFDGSQDVTITATVQPNSVALGADTTGNFVADVVAGAAISVTHTPGEASSASIALNASLNDLNDVVVSAPEEYQALAYDGLGWVPTYTPVVSYVRNAEAITITTGTAVYLFGGNGNHASVKRADNSSDATSSKTVGLMGASVAANNNGPVITRGYVDGINLSAYSVGDILWLGSNGALTTTKPTAPSHMVFIGVVVRATINGIVYVAVQNGYELEELHDVKVSSVANKDVLMWNSASAIWVNEQINLGTDTVGDYVQNLVAGTGVTLSNNSGEGSTPTVAIGQDVSTSASVVFHSVETTHDLTIGGNLYVSGSVVTENQTSLEIDDPFIYLNGSSSVSNVDLGIAGNYNDGTYRHAGIFRDATDGKFKFFDSYEPEPSSPIDTGHASYSAAPVVAETFESTITTGTAPFTVASTTEVTNLHADTASSLHTARAISLAGDLSGSVSFDGSGDVTLTATVEPNSVALGTDTTGNYMVDLSEGTGVTIVHTPGEGSTASISIGQSVATTASVTFAHVSADVTGNLTGDVTGNADTATTLETARAISLAGDLSGSVSFDGSGDVTLTATIGANSVALGTDTTGNYVNDVTAGTGVTVTHTPAEGSSPTIAIGQDVATTASVTFAHVSADLTGDVTGNSSTATALQNARSINLSGDLSGSASFDGTADVTITATVQPNSVALGTDTTGNYVNDVTAGTGVTVTHTPGEGSSPTIAIGQAVGTSSSVTFAAVTAPVVGNASTASTLQTARTISLGGDLSGSASFNGSSDVTITATVQPNSVALGTDTTGNYMSGVTAGTGVTVTHTPGEGSSATIAIGQAVGTTDNPSFAGVTADAIQIGVSAAGEIDTTTGNLTIDSAGGTVTVDDNLVVSGDLTVNGTTTTVNTETINLADNQIVLNSNETGVPSQNAGIEIERGTSTNVAVRWNETTDKWQITNDGSTYEDIATTADVSAVTITSLDEIGDVSASAPATGDFLKWNGTAWVNDAVNLGTDTVGNYMTDVVAGTGVTITHAPGEGSSASIAIGQAVSTSSSVTFAAVTAPVIGNASTATTLQTARAISLAGDLSGSVSFDGSQNVSITAAIQPNSVALGADTTGNYVADVVAGTGITVTHTPGEGSSASVALNAALNDLSDVDTSMAAADYVLGYDHIGNTWYAREVPAPTLDGLSDVSVNPSPSIDDVLKWDGAGWTSGQASITLDGLSDVSVNPSPTTDDVLYWDGAGWTSGKPLWTLDTLSDVDASSPVTDDFLKWDGASWVPAAIPTINAATTTTVSANTATSIYTFDKTTYRTAEAIIQVTQGSKYTSMKVLVLHDGTTSYATQYGIIEIGSPAITLTISTDISGSNVRLLATITDAATTNATVKVLPTTVAA